MWFGALLGVGRGGRVQRRVRKISQASQVTMSRLIKAALFGLSVNLTIKATNNLIWNLYLAFGLSAHLRITSLKCLNSKDGPVQKLCTIRSKTSVGILRMYLITSCRQSFLCLCNTLWLTANSYNSESSVLQQQYIPLCNTRHCTQNERRVTCHLVRHFLKQGNTCYYSWTRSCLDMFEKANRFYWWQFQNKVTHARLQSNFFSW